MTITRRKLSADFVVVGGGMAGLCAAVAAARNGAKTVILQDRPMFGGNASSEIRMWICGAHGDNRKEAGLLEELQLDNYYFNPTMSPKQSGEILSYMQPAKTAKLTELITRMRIPE